MKEPATNHININIMFNRENPKSREKPNQWNFINHLAKTLANPAKWAFTTHLQALHYNEVFPASYRLYYMKYHGPKPWVHKTMYPKTTTIYPSQHWLYLKSCLPNSLEKHKARFVARGFSQVDGIYYDETFPPVTRYSSIKSILALLAQMGRYIKWM